MIVSSLCLFVAGTACCEAQSARSSSSAHVSAFEGLVRDLACPIMNPKSTSTDFDLGCAQECAKSGSPLIILTRGGRIYFPISGEMPDTSQRNRLMPFIGKQVRVKGTIYERAGTRAIVITDIHATASQPRTVSKHE